MTEAIPFDLEDIKKSVFRKLTLLADEFQNIRFVEDNSPRTPTASTNGRDVFFNRNFMDTLSYEEQIFVLGHELLHIAFNHIPRKQDKDLETWNIATDAVINQILAHENLPIKDGMVNIPEAYEKSANEMYDILYKEKENKNGSSNDADGSQSGQSTRINNPMNNDSEQSDSPDFTQSQSQGNHDRWEEYFSSQSGESVSNDNMSQDNDISQGSSGKTRQDEDNSSNTEYSKATGSEDNKEIDKLEKEFSKENSKKKQDTLKRVIDKINEEKNNNKSDANNLSISAEGKDESVLDWKKYLKNNFDKPNYEWSMRRSSFENNYQSRITRVLSHKKPRTEIMLDTSGSISNNLLKAFLRQVKNILTQSEIYVGCFDDEFYGLRKIESEKDIENFKYQGGGCTNIELAVNSFSKDKKINRIIFTDGYANTGNTNPDEATAPLKIIYIIYDNPNYKNPYGRVFHVDSQKIINEDKANILER